MDPKSEINIIFDKNSAKLLMNKNNGTRMTLMKTADYHGLNPRNSALENPLLIIVGTAFK